MLENRDISNSDVFDIPYYSALRKYFIFLGQYPYKNYPLGHVIVFIMITSVQSMVIPGYLQAYESIRKKDLAALLESLPAVTVGNNASIKLLTMYLYRKYFARMYDLVAEEWKLLELKGEFNVLEKETKQGTHYAQVYRSSLLVYLVVFLVIPLICPFMDIVLPKNETRTRNQIFDLNYIFLDNDDDFFTIYLHLAWCSIVIVMIIVSVDSIYMILSHHNSALFNICGYQVKQLAKDINEHTNDIDLQNEVYRKLTQCVIRHNKAIQFYELLEYSIRVSMLVVVGLTILGISVTLFQVTMHLEEPGEALRCFLLFFGKQCHLFFINIPGQLIADQSINLGSEIYNSEWHNTPIKIRTLLHMMQIRCGRPCVLTAGGFYNLDMENFFAAFKMCMSYFTMMLSVKE